MFSKKKKNPQNLTKTIDVKILRLVILKSLLPLQPSKVAKEAFLIFNKSLPNEDLPHELNFYLASEHNSYSALF